MIRTRNQRLSTSGYFRIIVSTLEEDENYLRQRYPLPIRRLGYGHTATVFGRFLTLA
jgi:hypothetical protein